MNAKLVVAYAAVSLGFASSAFAACMNYTDHLGNGSIRCSDGRGGNVYKDQFGNTTARVGDERVNGYRDANGQTTIRIGDDRLILGTDQLRNSTARSPESRASYFGNTPGGSPLNCARDNFSNSGCR